MVDESDYSDDEMSTSSLDIKSIGSDLSSLYKNESELSFWSSNEVASIVTSLEKISVSTILSITSIL